MSILIYYKSILGFRLLTKVGIYYNKKFYYFSRRGLQELEVLEGSSILIPLREFNHSRFETLVLGTKGCTYSVLDLIPVVRNLLSCNKFSMLTWVNSCLFTCTCTYSDLSDVIKIKSLLTGVS